MKIAKKKKKQVRGGRRGGGGPVGGGGGSGQGGTGVCVRRIEVIEKMQKSWGGRGFQLVARLGVVGDVQYWVCKPRIEGIVICT